MAYDEAELRVAIVDLFDDFNDFDDNIPARKVGGVWRESRCVPFEMRDAVRIIRRATVAKNVHERLQKERERAAEKERRRAEREELEQRRARDWERRRAMWEAARAEEAASRERRNARIAALIRLGYRIDEIAEVFRVSSRTVRDIARSIGCGERWRTLSVCPFCRKSVGGQHECVVIDNRPKRARVA